MAMDLQSEPYSQYGDIVAEGIQKLLGSPTLDRLQTSYVKPLRTVRMPLTMREISLSGTSEDSAEQVEVLRTEVFGNLPENEASPEMIGKFRPRSACGYGNCRQTYHRPCRPHSAGYDPAGRRALDFIDFVRNVGSRRDTYQGSGTYGYGKSSLFMMSRCRR